MEALPEPSGGDRNKGPAYLAVALTFCAVACIFVLLRLFVRIRMIHSTGWDDVFICVALALSITTAGFNTTSELAAFGRHVYYLSNSQISRATKYTIFGEAFFLLSLGFSKTSICLFLLRILKSSHGKKKKLFLYFTIGLLTIATALAVVGPLGQCQPVSKQWNPNLPGHCGNPDLHTYLSYFNGAVAVWVDFSLAAFPITFIKDLQLSMRNKFALSGLLSFGVFAGVCAIVRTSLESSLSVTTDITWAVVDAGVWALVETNISITIACIPTLQPLFIVIVEQLTSAKASHDFPTDRYRARSGAEGLKRTGTFRMIGNAHDADHEVGPPTELTTYVSSGRNNDSGSEKNLVSGAEIPGISVETVIKSSSTRKPT